jgi:16S rRNA (cytidine1402-2'-O)-methyltransferase
MSSHPRNPIEANTECAVCEQADWQTETVLILGATPIGNLGDVSTRLREALETVEVIACEDTRTTAHLLSALGITHRPTLIALHEHNERGESARVVERAHDTDVLVLTDAGMPAVSDPGYRVVTAAIAAGVQVTCLPGPSAVLMALALSGLATDRFAFDGFLPRKGAERRALFAEVARETRTLIFFESPHRIAEALADARDVLGADRLAAVCRELTKMHEEIRRGSLGALADWAAEGVRGEIVILVAGAAPANISLDAALDQVAELTASGLRLKEACAQVADATGHSSRELYQGALARR